VQRIVYARHGRDCCGVKVPCTSFRVSRRSAYQMIAPIDKVLDEGNCGRVTKTIASGVGLTNAWLAEQGLLSLKTLWAELAPLR